MPDHDALVRDAVDARDSEETSVAAARSDVRAARNEPREAVRVALAAGVPAARLAEALGLSRARIYQMRDEAARFAASSTSGGINAPDEPA